MHQICLICMRNLNVIKNNAGQEVLKVVKVLHTPGGGGASDESKIYTTRRPTDETSQQQKHSKQIQVYLTATL